MKYKGINYDTGSNYREGRLSRENFDPVIVEKEIATICNELNCNAIRISGYDLVRLVTASEIALRYGLTVFFSPLNINAGEQDTKEYILKGAKEAEALRVKYGRVVFVLGCELSIFSRGFIKGDLTLDRLRRLFNPLSILLNQIKFKRKYNQRISSFMEAVVPGVREYFKGEITYASGTWESIDWNLFDLVGIDHYRSSYNKTAYRDELKRYSVYNKPVAVLEFGCCCYKGAEDKGGAGWMIIDRSKGRPALNGDYTRDETVQAEYLHELLDIFVEENIGGAFVFTFVQPSYIRREDPKYDLDMASYGIVAPSAEDKLSYKGMSWVPKRAFFMLAEYFHNISVR
ncbi:MAG: abortive infection protein [Ignavibacteriales bacterium]